MRKIIITMLAGLIVSVLSACGANDSSGPYSIRGQQPRKATQASAASYQTDVQELYIAYFGRPADPQGLSNFENALQQAGASTNVGTLAVQYSTNAAVKTLIDSFGTSKESQTLYGNGTTSDFVTAIFQNVLGRAPQQSGLDYWVGAIDSGSLSRGDAALAIMAGGLSNTSAQGLSDAQLIGARLAVAVDFTAAVSAQNAVSLYAGTAAAAAARNLLSRVDATSTVSSFTAPIDTLISGWQSDAPGITVLAGMNAAGSADGTGNAARFNFPKDIAVDAGGNIYVADSYNATIRKITPQGVVTTLAGTAGKLGSADGTGAAASFSFPTGIAVDASGTVYVADCNNQNLRKISTAGVVTTLAGSAGIAGSSNGTGLAARFNCPNGLALDTAGNLYVADTNNYMIRKVSPSGVVSTYAGTAGQSGTADGAATLATFESPIHLCFDGSGNLFVAQANEMAYRKISPGGTVSTVKWIGTYSNEETGIAADSAGNVYLADWGDSLIDKIAPDGSSTILAGAGTYIAPGYADGAVSVAKFNQPAGIALDAAGNLYVADSRNCAIRKITPTGYVSTLAGSGLNAIGFSSGNGSPLTALFNYPLGLAVDASGNVYVADAGNDVIRAVSTSGTVTSVVGAGYGGANNGPAAQFLLPYAVAIDSANNLYIADTGNNLIRKSTFTASTRSYFTTTLVNFSPDQPTGVVLDQAGNLYYPDFDAGCIYKVAPDGTLSVFAGNPGVSGNADGTGQSATFGIGPQGGVNGIAIDGAGNLYVTDSLNNNIRKISQSGVVSTLAGHAGVAGYADGSGTAAQFNQPKGIAIDSNYNVYVADSGNSVIRKITPSGVVSTAAGTPGFIANAPGPLPGALRYPFGVAIDSAGTLYVSADQQILRIKLE